MANQTKELLKSKYSLEISHFQLKVFIREYNNYKKPLSDCIKDIHQDPDDFYKFIIEHTEIPLFNERAK
jgi:hypothetical protein